MRENLKDNKIVLKGSDPEMIESMLKEMVSLNLHMMIKEVSCISSFKQEQINKLAIIIAPSTLTAPSKSIYVLSKTLQTDPKWMSVSKDRLTYTNTKLGC